MNDQRILIHVENGILDTVYIEDEMQTGEHPEIRVIDRDDQASDPVMMPHVEIKCVTTKDFEEIETDLLYPLPS